ncbi:hypothetical protein BS78_10G210600 [Paspalum vaginatum]|nr:hypothetical protein BS78_10G210600 [Paspalum vaginatum]
MEFCFRAGDRRPRPPSILASAGLRSRAAGHFHAEPPPPPPPLEFWEAAARRERIIREEVERRLIVEQEWLIERDAPSRARFHVDFSLPGPFAPPPPGTFFVSDRPCMPPPMPVGMQPNSPPPAPLGSWEGFDHRRRAGFEQQRMLLNEVVPSEPKASGTKRKADVISATTKLIELRNASSLRDASSATTEPTEPQNAAGEWSCALCQVSATSEAGLNQHLEGKRHKAKLVQCGAIKTIDTDKRGLQATTRNDNGAGPSDAQPKASGTKRKADVIPATAKLVEPRNASSATTEPTEPQNAAGEWSCALCQVSATSEAGLNQHLEGKRHKAKLVQRGAIKAIDSDKRGLQATTRNDNGAGPSDAPKKIHILVDGTLHAVVQRSNYVWCERCRVKCANAAAMADHLRGKKHSLLNKVWTSMKSVRMNKKNKEVSVSTCEKKVDGNGPCEITVEMEKETTGMAEEEVNEDSDELIAVGIKQQGTDVVMDVNKKRASLLKAHQRSRKKANKWPGKKTKIARLKIQRKKK